MKSATGTPQRILVTGGAQGIGKAVAKRSLEGGARVVIVDIDAAAGRETARELSSLGEIHFIRCDVGREADVRAAVTRAGRLLGGLDVLVNNAATFAGFGKPIEKLPLKTWERMLDVNLTGAFLCAKYAAPLLRRSKGSIINMASTRALMSEPHTESYAATKGGIVALTHALALSLGPAVRVNCISPGWIDVTAWQKKAARKPAALRAIDHAQHPAGRVGIPEDIAAAAHYLSSPDAGFITGVNLVVDGGMTRKMIYAE